jgi:DNA repair ATPase RecN
MTAQPHKAPKPGSPDSSKSPNSPTPPWKCTGKPDNGDGEGHGECTNYQFKCKICDRTYDDYLKENPIKKENPIEAGQRILLSSSGIAAIAALVLVIGAIAYARQKFAEADRAIIQLKQTKIELNQVNAELKTAQEELKEAKEKIKRVPELEKLLKDTQTELNSTKTQLQTANGELEKAKKELKRVPELEKALNETQTELNSTKTKLQTTQSDLAKTNQTLTQTKKQLQQKTQQVSEGSKCVKLMSEINRVTWNGAALNPDAVMRIQENLQSLGFYQGEIDGTFANITRKAANNFQENCQNLLEKR